MRALGGNLLNLSGILQFTQLSTDWEEKHNDAKNESLSPSKFNMVKQIYRLQGRADCDFCFKLANAANTRDADFSPSHNKNLSVCLTFAET